MNLQDVSYSNGPNKNQSLPLAPHLTINARLNYKVNENWSLGTVINHVGNQYYSGYTDYYNNGSDFPNRIPSYSTADVYLNYKTQKWDARITIKNLANTHYSTFGGIGWPEVTPTIFLNSYYYYPSDPRSVFASVSYNF